MLRKLVNFFEISCFFADCNVQKFTGRFHEKDFFEIWMMDRSPSDETMLHVHSRQMVEQFNRQSMNGQTAVGDNENMIVKTGEMENFLSRLPLRPFQQNKLETSKSSPTKNECGNFNEQQSDKFDNNHSPNLDHDDVERKERVLLRPWLESMIESGLVPGLEWIDEEKTMFKVPWKHRSKKTWSMKHSSVFLVRPLYYCCQHRAQ